jgi:palmitoyltransferase
MCGRGRYIILSNEIPLGIITFCGYGTMFEILIPYHDHGYQLIWFAFSLFMSYFSYYLAIVMPPGSPSADFKPAKGEWRRWCLKCNAYKPERTHHCRQCNKCVLRMDHHCMFRSDRYTPYSNANEARGLITVWAMVICPILSDS